METILQETLLYDFYGELLTEKQKTIFELFYQNDLTLTEIAQEEGISRQAVRDQLKRAEEILAGYEQKLHLVERFLAQKERDKEMVRLIKALEEEPGPTEKLKRLSALANAMMDSINYNKFFSSCEGKDV